MLNILGLELTKLIEVGGEISPLDLAYAHSAKEPGTEEVRDEATSYLEQILPVMLRFMADEYDDTASTIFSLLQVILTAVSVEISLTPRLINYFLVQTRTKVVHRTPERNPPLVPKQSVTSHFGQVEMGREVGS
jgi:hypothetical protein